MKSPVWSAALKSCCDPQRASHHLDLLTATDARVPLGKVSAEQARIVAELLGGSLALSNLLIANPGWLSLLNPEMLNYPRREQGLRRDVDGWLKPLLEARDYATALGRLRQFKQREMLRIGARDLARLANAIEITREISDVADVCLDNVCRICREQLTTRLGRPFHQDADGRWQPTDFCILGLGKLGGQELNYSSDVDLMFVYTEEGQVFKEPPGKTKSPASTLSNHQFFNRLVEAFVAEVTRMNVDGMLYRVDLRLRPEGDAGPPSRSLGSYENFYSQWGQTWERMMLIKARGIGGDLGLAAEFLETIQPFRYPRALVANVLREIAAMKERTENEIVKTGELDRNVKLGRGGIREIEFIAQALQLLHAGRIPFLQNPQTLPTLGKLVQYNLLAAAESQSLRDAYCFLRDVEHRVQMEDNRQTHTIPADRVALQRLAALMGCRTAGEFEAARKQHTLEVRRIYDRLFNVDNAGPPSPFPLSFDGYEGEWKKLLAERSFKDVEQSFRLLREFVEGPGYVHVSPRTVEVALQLIPKLFALCRADGGQPKSERLPPKTLSDPDRVLTRLDSYVSAYGARATLFEIWNTNPAFFELLLLLFDRSEFLAEVAIRTPDLVDGLVTSGRLRQRKSAEEILRDLRHGLADADQLAWLRRYHQAEQMRIGLRDILELADFEQNLAEYSALADACLQYALEVALRRNKIKKPPLVIVGLGKLGGAEINYGSDLDIMFVAAPDAKNLPNLQRVAFEVMEMLSRRTELGTVFATDARLRPDGEKGLLVNTLDAYEDYYRHRAQLWEIQAITRTRPVAGDPKLCEEFQKLVGRLADFKAISSVAAEVKRLTSKNRKSRIANRKSSTPPCVGCYTPDWKKEIHQMRLRIEKERTPAGKDDLAIKTGKGGLMDAEFIAQTLCLEHGWQEANTLRALERARESKALPDGEKLIENYRHLRRLEGILRRWSFKGESVLPDEDAPYYRVAVRCGFPTPEAFRKALAGWRKAIRQVYSKMFLKA